jgi:hypothetical protein
VHRLKKRKKYLLAIVALAAIGLSACGGEPSAQQNESKIRQGGYEYLAKHQPAHTMQYSPTRETINFWIDTWNKPGKLSYVYLQAANGQLVGYYILKGLPVTLCAALTPNYEMYDVSEDGVGPNTVVPAPGVDGVYYSGGQCNDYYGRDATTNSYMEFTVGSSMNMLVYERPLPRQDVEPLGFTDVDDVKP